MDRQTILSQLDRSYKKLLEALEIPITDPLAIDGTIHRFESTYEIACETISTFFRGHQPSGRFTSKSLRNVIDQGLIDNRETWQNLIRLKDQVNYSFSEILAKDIYESIRRDHHVFLRLIDLCRQMEECRVESKRQERAAAVRKRSTVFNRAG